jgi:dipeptidase E
MKLYLSSYRIPTPDDLAELLGKPLSRASAALIPNAKDYYGGTARKVKIRDALADLERPGLHVDVVDLQDYYTPGHLKARLSNYDLIWVLGGNTYVLRHEMRRSGFEQIIRELLDAGVVYAGDSAGALAAGISIAGVEAADRPDFAEVLIMDGLGLIPYVVLPHVDNPEFAAVLPTFRALHKDKRIIELTDSQAVIFNGTEQKLTTDPSRSGSHTHERLSQTQLADRLSTAAQRVTVGARYRHYKQLEYRVHALALREEDNEPCVIYQATYDKRLTWIRPLSNWMEDVEINGRQVKRFTKVGT